MGHYKSNLRDVEFNLFEVLRTQDHLGDDGFAHLDEPSTRAIIRDAERFAVEIFADGFAEGDHTPPRLEDGVVHVPESTKRSLDAFFDAGWHRLSLPDCLGGMGLPPSVSWAAVSLLIGANPAALCFTSGPTWAGVLDAVATDEQRARYLVPMVERRWGATMVLSEADAGSDVGAVAAQATPAGDGTWHIRGTKRFITSGDFDWPENIIHLVLARPEGASPGTKGLSMFFVPRQWVEQDGSLGERNGVRAIRLENKMGVRGSATCELEFGGAAPARGVLVGEIHDGMHQMFRIMNFARMLFGAKAIETLSTAYLNALAYARSRVQGPDLAQTLDPSAVPVPIIRHPDVRRMLLNQKAYAEGMRALFLHAAGVQDQMAIEPGNRALGERSALLLPLIKGYCSEKSNELVAQSMQVFGGRGYMRDYPIEQYLRDLKIDTIWEGTTGMQALDLVFRRIAKDQAAALGQLLEDVRVTAKGNGRLEASRARLARGLEDVEAMLGRMASFLGESVYLVGLTATPFLFALGDLLVGWLLLQHAEVAVQSLEHATTEADRAFYEGKIASEDWYSRTVLPALAGRRAAVENATSAPMELTDLAF